MNVSRPQGVTLLETILYVALLGIILPMLVAGLLRTSQEIYLYDTRSRLDASIGVILSQLANDVSAAQKVNVSASTFGVSASVLKLIDGSGTAVTIDLPTTSVSLPGGSQTVRRLRMQRGTAAAVYLTDPDVDVSSWQVNVVRNASAVLTGLRIHIAAAGLNPTQTGPLQKASFTSDTTISLQPQTSEQ